jgi:hypothetical protein
LLGFAASVILIRLFLELTGYPQVGNSELHIAHVLWGGLLLFGACLLTLIFANRWVYKAGALIAGVGGRKEEGRATAVREKTRPSHALGHAFLLPALLSYTRPPAMMEDPIGRI